MSETNETKNRRGFIVLSRAWYAEANRLPGRIDEITAGALNADGTPSDVLSIEWRDTVPDAAARLHSFHDGWAELAENLDVIRAFGELGAECGKRSPTVDEVVETLELLGFDEVTPTENPNP